MRNYFTDSNNSLSQNCARLFHERHLSSHLALVTKQNPLCQFITDTLYPSTIGILH